MSNALSAACNPFNKILDSLTYFSISTILDLKYTSIEFV